MSQEEQCEDEKQEVDTENDEDDPDNKITGVLETDANETYPDHVNNPADLAIENNVDDGNINQESNNAEETTRAGEEEEYSPDERDNNEVTGLIPDKNETLLPEHANDKSAVPEVTTVEKQSDYWRGSTHAGRASRPYDYKNTCGTTNLTQEKNSCSLVLKLKK